MTPLATGRTRCSKPASIVTGSGDASPDRIAAMLAQLSPSNVQLAESIIRCILADQENDVP